MTSELTGAERYLASRMDDSDYRDAYEAAVTGPMNVITLYQPYASLVMAGIKTWETRGLPPHGDMRPEGVRGLPGKRINAGDRILIHAARTWAPGWLRWYNPDRSDTDLALTDALEEIGVEFGESDGYWYPNPMSLPLGAILGTVEVRSVLPIVFYDDGPPAGWDESLPIIDTSTSGGVRRLTLWRRGDIEGYEQDITDQVPFGNWKPGNWAWELADPIPTTELCPVCERRRARPFPGGYPDDTRCWACNSDECCNPIPAKGKQGVWQWTT